MYILAYNLRFTTRLSKKHPNIWGFMQLIQREQVHFEHISTQLDARAALPNSQTNQHCKLENKL